MNEAVTYLVFNLGLGVAVLVAMFASGLAGFFLAYTAATAINSSWKLPGYEASAAYVFGHVLVVWSLLIGFGGTVLFYLGEFARTLFSPPWSH